MIGSGQIKAARAILGWSQEELALAANLSVATIYNLEKGQLSPRSAAEIRKALECGGIEFLDHDGVRRRVDDIRIFHGTDALEQFWQDIQTTTYNSNPEILCFFKSQSLWDKVWALKSQSGNGFKKFLPHNLDLRLLVTEIHDVTRLTGNHCRRIFQHCAGPVPYIVYGSKHAIVLLEGNPRFVVMNSAAIADTYRQHFNLLWENALPLTATK